MSSSESRRKRIVAEAFLDDAEDTGVRAEGELSKRTKVELITGFSSTTSSNA